MQQVREGVMLLIGIHNKEGRKRPRLEIPFGHAVLHTRALVTLAWGKVEVAAVHRLVWQRAVRIGEGRLCLNGQTGLIRDAHGPRQEVTKSRFLAVLIGAYPLEGEGCNPNGFLGIVGGVDRDLRAGVCLGEE